jgi:hypothetical protein
MNNLNQILFISMSAVLGGMIGYFVGIAKAFREQKQKAYEEILPVIIRVAYNAETKDEEEFGRALSKLWLYGSKKVTSKMDTAVAILHDPTRGDKTKALQEAVAVMRQDVQILPWQKVEPEDVKHLYSHIGK